MMMKHKNLVFHLKINYLSRVFLILGCCFFLSFSSSFSQDSIPKKEIPESVPKAEAKADNIYSNPNYFANIPIEKKTFGTDSIQEKQSFKKIHSKYNSSEFNYQENRINRLSWWDRLSRRISDFLNSLLPKLQWNLSNAFYYTIIGIGLAILIFVIYKLTTSGKKIGFREVKENEVNSPEWVEKKLQELNLQTFLDQALSEKNYMLAIRYLHLINLKKLAASGQIEWHYQKTNHEFLWELKNKELITDFASTIRIYEYIWYGKFKVAENKFGEYRQIFNQFNQKIA